MTSQVCGVQPGVGDRHRRVRPVLIQNPLVRLNVDCLNLEELDDVIEEREGDDGEDVAEAVAHVALLEWQAHRHKPLNCHRNNLYSYSTNKNLIRDHRPFKISQVILKDVTGPHKIARLSKKI